MDDKIAVNLFDSCLEYDIIEEYFKTYTELIENTMDDKIEKYTELQVLEYLQSEENKGLLNQLREYTKSSEMASELSNILGEYFGISGKIVGGVLRFAVFELLDRAVGQGVEYAGKSKVLKIVGAKAKNMLVNSVYYQQILWLICNSNSVQEWVGSKSGGESQKISPEDYALLSIESLFREIAAGLDNKLSSLDSKLTENNEQVAGMAGEFGEFLKELKPEIALSLKTVMTVNRFLYNSSGKIPYQRRAIARQLKLAEKFIEDKMNKFSWIVVAGEAGTGKSRFAWEILNQYGCSYRVGFLNKGQNFDWHNWKPSTPTVLAIDYAGENPDVVGDILRAFYQQSSKYEFPVRVMLLEREGQRSFKTEDGLPQWLDRILGSSSTEREGLRECCWQESALLLNLAERDLDRVEDDLWEIMSAFFDRKESERESLLAEFRSIDEDARPLFAAFFADAKAEGEETLGWDKERLIDHVIRKNIDKYWSKTSGEHLVQDLRLLAVATICGKVDSEFFEIEGFPDKVCADWEELLDDKKCFEALGGDCVAEELYSLRPDVIGELFVLRTFYSGKTVIRSKKIAAIMEFLWGNYPEETANFFSRAWDDFAADDRLRKLFRVCLPDKNDITQETLRVRFFWCYAVRKAALDCTEFAEYYGYIVTFADKVMHNDKESYVLFLIIEMLKNFKYQGEDRRAFFRDFFADLSTDVKQELEKKKVEYLNRAAFYGIIELAEFLCQGISREDVNSVDEENKYFPLLLASHKGHLDVVRCLAGEGADVNQCNVDNGSFPLLLASQNGHLDVVRYLVEKDADVNKYDAVDGLFPLLQASQEGHLDVVRCLVEKDADVNQCNVNDGSFPLLQASQNGHLDVVRCLVGEGADVNQCNVDTGSFPLLLASQNGHLDVVRYLVEKDADVNKYDAVDGLFPLLQASQEGHLDVVRCLVEKDADVNQCNVNNGVFPLLQASQNGHLDVVRCLAGEGADVNQYDAVDGSFPLLLASQEGHLDVVWSLVGEGADVNQCDVDKGSFPLLLASQNGHLEVVRYLVGKGADVNQCKGVSSIIAAAFTGHIEIVKYLLTEKADVSIVDNDGDCALSVAARNQHIEVVRLLLENKVDPERYVRNAGKTILEYARDEGNQSIINLLEEAVAGEEA